MPALPEDPRLRLVAGELAKTRWASAVVDAGWHLRWVSDDLAILLGTRDEESLGYGRHMYANYMSDAWRATITLESQSQTVVTNTPYVMYDTDGGKPSLLRAMGEDFGPLLDCIDPVRPPPLWTDEFDFIQGELPPLRVRYVHCRLHDPETKEHIGTAIIYGSALPARVLSLVGRGDEGMFERMSRLIEPGRRAAAILFADLQASSALSRRLPSAAYFRLIQAITTAIDDVLVGHQGIVGKHAGDGVTAFFLADDLGSPSRAARAAITGARDISVAVRDAVKELGDAAADADPDECPINIAVHWGGTLYIGQLVTGGRLEVTALGDEVNECARIQQTARDGAILATKAVVEQLDRRDAAELGLDPDTVTYRMLSDLPGAPDKAVRDAGTIPVSIL